MKMDAEHFEILKRSAADWNTWRKANPDVAPNLRGANLRGAKLGGADLSRANLLVADLSGADLSRANLVEANLDGADFSRANLREANLSNADLCWADLSGAKLSGANLDGADLGGADLSGADLSGTCLDPGNAPNADVSGFEVHNGFVVGYRTPHSPCMGGPGYSRGGWYEAPWFSTSDTDCHPGLYLHPERWWEDDIAVRTLPELVHRAGDKWRCRRFVVAD